MNHPKVYDATKGRVLKLGSRVETKLYGPGQVTGLSLHTPNLDGMTISVLMDGGVGETRWHAKPWRKPKTFQVAGLTLITDEEKGDGDGS
jgi:hypothetical protein